MRILLGYAWTKSPILGKAHYERLAARLQKAGIDIDPFVLTLNPPGDRLGWPELDRRWKTGDRKLLSLYESLSRTLEKYDVFLNFNGINVHPDLLPMLPTFNVYSCSDDPESSDDLSKPVAASYDLCLVGNIAEVETYRSWGVKNARWWPLGFRADDYDPTLTKERILNGERDVNLALVCERLTAYRRERVDRVALHFPEGAFYGPGWPAGFLPEEQRVPLLQRTKVGINIHNSTGPINFRTFYLPANGVLQVCDNKRHLQQIYELGKEAVGFETIEEAIDLCDYYLTHDDERRMIAAAGWERAVRDYSEVACFQQVITTVNELQGSRREPQRAFDVETLRRQTAARRLLSHATAPAWFSFQQARRILRGGMRRAVRAFWNVRYSVRRARLESRERSTAPAAVRK